VNDPLTTLHARIDRLNYWHEILTKFEYSPSGELLIAFQQAVRDMVNEDILHSQWINGVESGSVRPLCLRREVRHSLAALKVKVYNLMRTQK